MTIKNRAVLLLIVITLLLSAYMVYWGTQKEGFYVDEMFSMMDIRGGGLDRPYKYEDFFNKWHTAPELESTIGVNAGNAFSAAGQHRNLYMNLLHIAYSLFPGGFTLWPALALNIVFFAGCLVVIYLLSRFFIEDKYLALLPCLMWGLGSAAVNLVLFIRFYTLKTLLCLLTAYFMFAAVKSGFRKWRYLIAALLTAGIGIFVHQYFLIYIFFLTVFVSLYLLLCREFKPLLKLTGTMLAVAAAYELITGGGISAFFTGTVNDRSEEALRALLYGSPGFLSHVGEYLDIAGRAVFGSVSIYIALSVSAVAAAVVFYAHAKKPEGIAELLSAEKTFLWIITGGVCLAYLLMVAYIAPYREIRYIFCITPFIVILFVSVLVSALRTAGVKGAGVIFAVVSLISVLLPIGSVRSFEMHWDTVKTDEELASYYHLPVVCIGNREIETATCYWQFFEFEDEVLFATVGDADYGVIGGKDAADGLLLALWQESDGDEIMRVMDAAGMDSSTYVADMPGYIVYYLENSENINK